MGRGVVCVAIGVTVGADVTIGVDVGVDVVAGQLQSVWDEQDGFLQYP